MTENHARLSPALVETIAGLSAGTISTLAVHPLDVIKTRLQSSSASSLPPKYKMLTIGSSSQHIKRPHRPSKHPPLPTRQRTSCTELIQRSYTQPNRQCQFLGYILLLQIYYRKPASAVSQSLTSWQWGREREEGGIESTGLLPGVWDFWSNYYDEHKSDMGVEDEDAE